MPDLFAGKHRIESTRLEGWDYSRSGYYFVTICTNDRVCWFGDVVDGLMQLSPVGEIIVDRWFQILTHFDDVMLDEFVVMPNHVHGIIIIKQMKNRRDAINRVSTNENDDVTVGGITGDHTPMLHKSLSTVIRWFKGRSTYEIHRYQNQNKFAWQPRFYDSIIRNEKSLGQIRQYIIDNPRNWAGDRNNPEIIIRR